MEDCLKLEAMNTTFYIAVTECKEKNWQKPITSWIRYVDKEWSRFQTDNELYRLNNLKIGEEMTLTPPLFDILQKAEHYRKSTGGLFSPYLYPQLQFHGYRKPFPFQKAQTSNYSMPELYHKETAPFEFDSLTFSVRRVETGKVDLGGIGKGYAVQAAAQWLKEIGHARTGIVDGGGDITVWSGGSKEWIIGVAHPFFKEREIAQYRLKNGSIATSNTVYRSWKQGDQQKTHILDGRTGMPVKTSLIQATVVTDDCLDAEVAAKLCFMVDDNDLENQLQRYVTIHSLLLVDQDGNISHHQIGGKDDE